MFSPYDDDCGPNVTCEACDHAGTDCHPYICQRGGPASANPHVSFEERIGLVDAEYQEDETPGITELESDPMPEDDSTTAGDLPISKAMRNAVILGAALLLLVPFTEDYLCPPIEAKHEWL